MTGETDLNTDSDSKADVERGSWRQRKGEGGPWDGGRAPPTSPHPLCTSPLGILPVLELSTCFPTSRPLLALFPLLRNPFPRSAW